MLLLDSSGLLHADFILLDLFPFNMQKCDLFALSMKNIDFQSLQLKKQNNTVSILVRAPFRAEDPVLWAAGLWSQSWG